MKNTLKGLIAASGATFLLVGGASTLAYWTDASPLDGATMSSGALDLSAPDCGSGWVLDGGDVFVAQEIVPGDSLSKICTIDLVATGDHLAAGLTIEGTDWTGDAGLTGELAATAVFTVNGATTTTITSEDDNGAAGADEIEATITVTFDGATATNASQDLAAVLDEVAITATQTHDAS